MNNLSWLLYLADISASISAFLVIATIASFILFLMMGVLPAMIAAAENKPRPRLPRTAIAGLLAMGLSACLFPSSKTVYMIAASEAGERIAATAEAREMLDLVRQKLKTVLTDKT